MTKADIVRLIAQGTGLTKTDTAAVVDGFIESVIDALEYGDHIEIRGFGSFVNREYGSYKGRNPRTGEVINVGEKKLPFFKVGKELKEDINKNIE